MDVAANGSGTGVVQILVAVGGAVAGAALIAWGLLETARPIIAEPELNDRQVELFLKRHPCPASGKKQEACPGYVVTYVKPLCIGGTDRAGNMRWQTVAQAKKKAREARKLCEAKAKRA